MKFMLFSTYISRIKKSLGTSMFQNTFFEDNGKVRDVTEDGDLSCAIFTSSILKMFDLIGELHVNVKSTAEDMLRSGWEEITSPKPGAVLVWETIETKSGPHKHIGFCIDEDNAISNDSLKIHVPIQHHITYHDKRKIEKIFWHPRLDH